MTYTRQELHDAEKLEASLEFKNLRDLIASDIPHGRIEGTIRRIEPLGSKLRSVLVEFDGGGSTYARTEQGNLMWAGCRAAVYTYEHYGHVIGEWWTLENEANGRKK